MWPKVLSWVALVCNVLAVVFNVGVMLVVVVSGAYGAKGLSLAGEVIGLIIVGVFLLSGPILTIFALLFGAPLVRRSNAPLAAAVFD